MTENTVTIGNLTLINPSCKPYGKGYILCFGAYGDTYLHVYASSLDDALDECVDYLADASPGLLCDDEVNEAYEAAYNEAIEAGEDEDEAMETARELAEVDTTQAGNCSNYLRSWEWRIVAEDVTGRQLCAMVREIKAKHG